RGVVGEKEARRRSDLLGLCEPAERNSGALDHCGALRWYRGPELPQQCRVRPTGAEAVHANALASELARERACEQHDAAFGRAVGLVHRLPLQAGLGRHVEDDAPPAAAQMSERGAAAEVDAA